VIGGLKNPADGFFLINELRSPRKQQRFPQPLIGRLPDCDLSHCQNHSNAHSLC
jgi:hypothetical protein